MNSTENNPWNTPPKPTRSPVPQTKAPAKSGGLEVDFDGMRTSLAQAYNELALFFKEAHRGDALEFIDPDDIEEHLEPLRQQIGLILCLRSDAEGFYSIADRVQLEASDLDE